MIFNNLGIVAFWAFILGTTLTAIVPGANTYRVLDFSYKYGAGGGVWSSFGVILADITFMVAAALGLTSLLALFPALYGALLLCGGIYFLKMSLVVLRNPTPINHKFTQKSGNGNFGFKEKKSIFMNSYMTCVSNFKAIFFYTLFFPKFIDPSFRPAWLPFALLCCTVLVILIIYYSLLSIIGVWFFSSARGETIFKYVTVAFGIFIGILSIKLFQEFIHFAAGYMA